MYCTWERDSLLIASVTHEFIQSYKR
jgi:hypothetical protein